MKTFAQMMAGVLLLSVTQIGVAEAHGDFRWVMENPKTKWCCGKEDCRDLNPGEAQFTGSGWSINGYPVPAHNVYDSPRAHPDHMSACFYLSNGQMTRRPRCLFKTPPQF